MKNFIQHNPPHPGEVLLEFYFTPLNLSVTEAAKKLDIPRPNLSNLVNGKMGISALMAAKLARAFKNTPQYWLTLQTNYELSRVMLEQGDQIKNVPILV